MYMYYIYNNYGINRKSVLSSILCRNSIWKSQKFTNFKALYLNNFQTISMLSITKQITHMAVNSYPNIFKILGSNEAI